MSTILQTVIAFLAIVILFSIANSLILEGIGRLIKRRAKELEKAIKGLLKPDENGAFHAGNEIYDHSFIKTLREAEGNDNPSAIASDVFAETFIDVMVRQGKVNKGDPDPVQFRQILFHFQRGIQDLPERVRPAVTQLLRYVLDQQEHQLETLKQKLAGWYEVYMGQLTERFKRKSRVYLFWIGLLLAALLNLDAIFITHSLINDDELRLHYYAVGKDLSADNLEIDSSAIIEYISENLTSMDGNELMRVVGNSTRVKGQSAAIAEAPSVLPIGWVEGASKFYQGFGSGWLEQWIWKVIGIIIMAGALSFGAPFWFDVLRRVAKVNGVF